MNDLSKLDWSAATRPDSQPSQQSVPSFPVLRPSVSPSGSGRSTPLPPYSTGLASAPKPSTPDNDSFSGLLSINTAKLTKGPSLQERQKQLLEEKARQEAERRRKEEHQFGAHDAQFWNNLGGGQAESKLKTSARSLATGAAAPTSSSQSLSGSINKPFAALNQHRAPTAQTVQTADDDLLSAFNASTPVDNSSHFPAPRIPIDEGLGGPNAATTESGSGKQPEGAPQALTLQADDDDPFGLGAMPERKVEDGPVDAGKNDEDDILGMLGKPVSELPPKQPRTTEVRSVKKDDVAETETKEPHEEAVQALVDMGFPAEKAKRALASTESGADVQGAVSVLLSQAHEESRQKMKRQGSADGREAPRDPDHIDDRRGQRSTRDRSTDATPAWMRDQARNTREDGRSSAKEKDVTQLASQLGNNLFKSANTLWKTGQKKVQKAVAEFQQDADPNQPKWMRDASPSKDPEIVVTRRRRDVEAVPPAHSGRQKDAQNASMTDEAMMLESGGSRPQGRTRPNGNRAEGVETMKHYTEQVSRNNSPRPVLDQRKNSQTSSSREQSPFARAPISRLTRSEVEEQSAQAYVSPARRKARQPEPKRPESTESALPPNRSAKSSSAPLSTSPPLKSNNPFLSKPPSHASEATKSKPIPKRPSPPVRNIPRLPDAALSSSTSQRLKGTEAFKLGDYAAAHAAYSSALAPLPDKHPLAIVILCNRALTNIKNGDPKAAIADADAALAIIGPSRGEHEKIDVGGAEAAKDMKELFGKALMRKAEALENMEKWADAGKVWKDAVEAGVGGAMSIEGKRRCDKAVGGTSKPQSRPQPHVQFQPAKKPPARASALEELSGRPSASNAASAEAVQKLRAANAAAERADDEKFALTDQVDATLVAWKGSKADNLRALLGSLDTVLWAEAGWKKVGMSDLVMPNKVKIVYMKAIAKVHPDKLSQTATTEQKMISAAVFSTLNEAWEKFKKDNGL